MKIIFYILALPLFCFSQMEINPNGSTINNSLYIFDFSMSPNTDIQTNDLNNQFKFGVLHQYKKTEGGIRFFNFVTANNDGKNDFFEVENPDSKSPIQVTIFDRQGNKVFESKDYQNSWNGEKLEVGPYFFRIIKDDTEIKDLIFLSR